MERMIHYHGTPITPRSVLYTLAGKFFCVSWATPQDVEVCHKIGQGVMLDNGGYSFWRRGETGFDCAGFCEWALPWMDFHTTWAVIPDIVAGSESDNDGLIAETLQRIPNLRQLAPVWHLHESLDRLDRLVRGFDRVCMGSSGEYAVIGSTSWNNRMNEAFNRICKGSGKPQAWIHMLRGMSLSASIYPFASADSTDVARNHNRPQNAARGMADSWDALQTPARWTEAPIQMALA